LWNCRCRKAQTNSVDGEVREQGDLLEPLLNKKQETDSTEEGRASTDSKIGGGKGDQGLKVIDRTKDYEKKNPWKKKEFQNERSIKVKKDGKKKMPHPVSGLYQNKKNRLVMRQK